MFLWRNKRVAINFVGMLLVACKQLLLPIEMLKTYDSAVVIPKWKHYWRNNKHIKTSENTNQNSISTFFEKDDFLTFHAVDSSTKDLYIN